MSSNKLSFYYLGLGVTLLLLMLMSLSTGAIHIPLNKLFYLAQHHDASVENMIMHIVRMPRTLCGRVTFALSVLWLQPPPRLNRSTTRSPTAQTAGW